MTVPVPNLTAQKHLGPIRRLIRRVRNMTAPTVIELNVHLAYDDEADVWYVAASDIPGLSLEAENPQRLIARIQECACDLIALNETEILHERTPREKPTVAVRPVFDSPLRLAEACA